MTDKESLIVKLKRRLGIPADDTQEDLLLSDIIEDAQGHFMLLTKGSDIEAKYDFIILDVADARYNRKGSTGMKSESVDGYSVTWKDAENDFKPYWSLLKIDFNLEGDGERKRGNMVMW